MALFGRQIDLLSGTYFLKVSMLVAKSTRWACRPLRKDLEIKPFSKVRFVCGSTRSPAELMKKPRNVIVMWSWLKNRYGWGLNNERTMVRHTAHRTWEFKRAKKKQLSFFHLLSQRLLSWNCSISFRSSSSSSYVWNTVFSSVMDGVAKS